MNATSAEQPPRFARGEHLCDTGPVKVLLVEDDRSVRVTVNDALEQAGFEVTACADGRAGQLALEYQLFDLVLTDVRLPGASGLDLFRLARQRQPSASVVLMTAWANTDDAVTVMREGARDYISKPFEIDELVLRLGRAKRELEDRRSLELGANSPRAHQLRGEAEVTRRLLTAIEAAATSDVNVLITGETGSGKDLCARTIHERSQRAGRPFVSINCAALPADPAAFDAACRLSDSRGGTVCFDEVGELPAPLQARLVEVLDRAAALGVRVFASTQTDLTQALTAQRLRQDLYYRLNVLLVQVPPLRERRADIPLLVADFLSCISVRQRRPTPTVSPGALALLASHTWPGNVRELVHALEHAVALAQGAALDVQHLPRAICEQPEPEGGEARLSAIVSQFERQYIRQVLIQLGGRRTEAARVLGISRKSLWQKLRAAPE